jgi:prepilin-type processing-associated H-X9-DG protein
MQCTNHLKQIGIGTHNFHDTLKGLPPVMIWMGCSQGYEAAHSTQTGRMSFWGTIYPFVEQQALYEKCTENDDGTIGGSDRCLNADWWHKLTPAEKKGFGSVAYYRCPSRRGGGALYADETTNTSPGPQTDYAILAGWYDVGPEARLLNKVWMPGEAQKHFGPFRVAEAQLNAEGQIYSWLPRDTFAWWQDGTSNQIIVSEKHIPTYSLGKCECTETAETVAPDSAGTRLFDCSYLAASSNSGSITKMRADIAAHAFVVSQVDGKDKPPHNYYGRLIARSDAEMTVAERRWIMNQETPVFGSAHPGVFNVLMGDGSVHGFPKTANPHVVSQLSVVNDGKAHPLPTQ